MGGIYNAYTGNDYWAWLNNGRTDNGFFNYQRLLRSGQKTDIGNAVTGWNSCAMDLRTVVNQLTSAYQAISGTWSGEAANAFYAEMAKVQNYAMSLLLQIDSSMANQGSGNQLISALVAGSGSGSGNAAGTGGGYVTPDPAAGGYAAMVGSTGGASTDNQQVTPTGGGNGTTINGDMVSILSDASQMLDQATALAHNTLPDPNSYGLGDIGTTAWKLSTWMCGQVAHESWQDNLAFFTELVGYEVTTVLVPEAIAVLPAILMIAETLNTPFSEPVRQLVLGSTTVKVMLDTLGWHSTHPDGSNSPPMNNMNAMGWGWVMKAKGLPGKLDPSRITGGTSGTGPAGPGYPGPGSSNLPGGLAHPLSTSPVSTPKLTTPTDTNGVKVPTTGTDPFKGTDTGFKPYDPHGASLASYNPHSGLGGGSGLGGLGGLNPHDGQLASYDPRAGLGTGDGTAGAGPGSGAGSGGNGSLGGAAGASGRAMPMSPGSGAGGNKDDKGRNRTAYLSEDEDVWGVGADGADGVL